MTLQVNDFPRDKKNKLTSTLSVAAWILVHANSIDIYVACCRPCTGHGLVSPRICDIKSCSGSAWYIGWLVSRKSAVLLFTTQRTRGIPVPCEKLNKDYGRTKV